MKNDKPVASDHACHACRCYELLTGSGGWAWPASQSVTRMLLIALRVLESLVYLDDVTSKLIE